MELPSSWFYGNNGGHSDAIAKEFSRDVGRNRLGLKYEKENGKVDLAVPFLFIEVNTPKKNTFLQGIVHSPSRIGSAINKPPFSQNFILLDTIKQHFTFQGLYTSWSFPD